MRPIEQLLIVAYLALSTAKGAFGQMKPLNAVSEIGGEVIFNCSATSFLPNWIMSKDGTSTSQLPIAGSCNVNANLQNHYETEQKGGPAFICNLIVFNVTMEQAGVYWCVGSGAPSYALLTVLDSSPSITYNNTPDVIERENVVITCTLSYNGSVEPASTLRPHFFWTDYTGNNVSSFYDSTPVNSPVMSQLTVAAGRQDITPYTCHVYLKLVPTTSPGYASNTPTVNSSASSPTVAVLCSLPTTLSTRTSSTTASNSCDVTITTAAIALGVILFISLAMNLIQLICLIRNQQDKHEPDLIKRAENIPEILNPSDPSTSSAYEELRRTDEIQLQPTTYQELTLKPPLYVNRVP